MPKKQLQKTPEMSIPDKKAEIKPADPEEPLNLPEDDPDIIPEDEPFENPPAYEEPQAGEGP